MTAAAPHLHARIAPIAAALADRWTTEPDHHDGANLVGQLRAAAAAAPHPT